ncbi:MAG: hypothetical protein EOM87_04715 [Clostridia bacterium]|nr:hypothetical protein [Clostridia bacterium]
MFDEKCEEVIIDKLLHEIRTDTPAFLKKINPRDLIDSFVVQPARSNLRMLRQDGAFIISGLSKTPSEESKKLHTKVYAEIQISSKAGVMENILAELDRLGINEATLFPEIDKVANYLKQM